MKIKSNPSLTVLTIVFGLLFFNFFFYNKILFYSSLVISALGVFSSKFSKIIEIIWFKLSFILSQIIPNILLSIIFSMRNLILNQRIIKNHFLFRKTELSIKRVLKKHGREKLSSITYKF